VDFEAFSAALRAACEATGQVDGLVLLGSTSAAGASRRDEWSDHDVYVVLADGAADVLRSSLAFLPFPERVVARARESQLGFAVLYDDGHLLEFAVFDLEEIALAGVNRYRTLLDRGGVEEACAHVRDHPRPQHDDEHLFGMVVTAALVAVGRGRRGEVLSAAFLVTWGLTYLARLIARVVPAENSSILDNFDSLRRFERAYPALGEELAAAVRLAPPEAGLRLLEVLEREVRPLRPDLAWGALDAVVARAQRP
jgi:hypothetical protein